ncbi:hypothetical protein G6F57_022785 [Rhizopus arrhizus]|nr:hypothetical protein G6F57_022785 [Rhizopus arrhizus]
MATASPASASWTPCAAAPYRNSIPTEPRPPLLPDSPATPSLPGASMPHPALTTPVTRPGRRGAGRAAQ